MQKKPIFDNRFLSLVTRLITSSVLAEIAVIGIAAFPSQAATISSSQGKIEFNNFNHNPLDTQTSTNPNTSTNADDNSLVFADAQAEASFNVEPAFAVNKSSTQAVGEGSNYTGSAQSESQVIGNFSVEAGQTFSFNFAADLNLNTSIDNATVENASATGDLSFFLVDSHQPLNIYDSFVVSGNLTTPENNDFIFAKNSDNLSVNVNSFTTDFDGTQESVSASVNGSLESSFFEATLVTLIESNTNNTSVSVPEPENTVALLLFLGFLGVRYKARKKIIGVR